MTQTNSGCENKRFRQQVIGRLSSALFCVDGDKNLV